MDDQSRRADWGVQDSNRPFHGDDRNSRHDGCAIHHGEVLFHLEGIGGQIGFFDCLQSRHSPTAVEDLPISGQRGGDVRHGRQVTGGPDRSFARNNRRNAALVQKGGDLLQQGQSDARIALARQSRQQPRQRARALSFQGILF